MTRADLVNIIGSRARISEVLNRRRPPTITMIAKLRDEFGPGRSKTPFALLMLPRRGKCRQRAEQRRFQQFVDTVVVVAHHHEEEQKGQEKIKCELDSRAIKGQPCRSQELHQKQYPSDCESPREAYAERVVPPEAEPHRGANEERQSYEEENQVVPAPPSEWTHYLRLKPGPIIGITHWEPLARQR